DDLRDVAEHAVAGEVTVLVVDALEVVQVENDERNRLGRLSRTVHHLPQRLLELLLVHGARERVQAHHALDLLVVDALDVAARHVLELQLADTDPVTVLEDAVGDPLAVHEGAVGGAEIDQAVLRAVPLDPSVTAAHRIGVQDELARRATADLDGRLPENAACSEPWSG